ncbi:sugar diacid recognition domain-containing protein [Clostridium sp. chh4-2]|uniref:CdaR family transcriptional regulator n=1 Tax=Clostridium sp. chh4-2 TaxID=2067550 RepID=UPI0015E172C6|nr:sugar diacid recognition domain-containing protein [Clostridium sp. chh4-2]
MIDVEIAQNFIQKMQRQIDVPINIMNEKGIIIASSSPERVGDFHQLAYDMIVSRQSISITENLDEGKAMYGVLKPGINMLLQDGTEISGVLGLSGSPAENIKLAKLIKFSLETLLEADSRQRSVIREQQANSKLCNALLFEQPINPSRISRLAKERGFHSNTLRIPILVKLRGEYDNDLLDHVITGYASLKEHQSQDMILKVDATNLLILKSLKQFDPSYFDDDMKEFCASLDALITSLCDLKGLLVYYYYSAPCQDFNDFRNSYQCLHWLSCHIQDAAERIHPFRQHLISYLFSMSPAAQLEPVFEKYAAVIREHMAEEVFLTTIRALIICDMNLAATAQQLYIHKNTLNARIKKIKTLLGIDPFFNVKDAIFLIGLFHYMEGHAPVA